MNPACVIWPTGVVPPVWRLTRDRLPDVSTAKAVCPHAVLPARPPPIPATLAAADKTKLVNGAPRRAVAFLPMPGPLANELALPAEARASSLNAAGLYAGR